MNKLTDVQKSYLSGLFDGEGCVNLTKCKSKSKAWEYDFHLRALITNSNIEVIHWAHDITGIGCIFRYEKAHNKKWKPVHRWVVCTKECLDFLEAIRPYSIIKRDVIDLAVSLRQNRRGGYPRTQEIYKSQNNIFEAMKEKNRRGALAL